MGDVGNFFLGGSKQKQNSQNSSSQSSSSQNSSQNTNVQGSQSYSNQASANASGTANRAYDPLSASLTPSLGYVSSAGNMLGALLGLPPSTFSYQAPPSSPMPGMPHPSSGGKAPGLVDQLFAAYMKHKLPGASPAPTPAPAVPPTNTGVVPPVTSGVTGGTTGGYLPRMPEHREMGGPVQAGQPYVVGEKRPELFVPHTSGTIVPSVPQGVMGFRDLIGRRPVNGGVHTSAPTPATPATPAAPAAPATPPIYNPTPPNPTDAVNTFANSAGMNFILDQGQKAISGASAANGTFNSGATGQALVQYGQNLGKQYLGDYMNRLLDYAKLGLGSASALTGAGGVSQSAGSSTGGSSSSSIGIGQGSSQGTSTSTGTSTGTSSGSGNSKKGLIPDILG